MPEQDLRGGAQAVGQRDSALDEVPYGQVAAEQLPREREVREIVVGQRAAERDPVERSEGGDQDADSSVAVPEREDHEGAIVMRSTVSCYRMSRVSDPA